MEFEIDDDKLLKVMIGYAKLHHPELLTKFDAASSHYLTEYWSQDGVRVLVEFDDRDIWRDTKWYVNETLEDMYDLFGLESFQYFFLKLHKIDLTNRGDKKTDWLFDSLDSN